MEAYFCWYLWVAFVNTAPLVHSEENSLPYLSSMPMAGLILQPTGRPDTVEKLCQNVSLLMEEVWCKETAFSRLTGGRSFSWLESGHEGCRWGHRHEAGPGPPAKLQEQWGRSQHENSSAWQRKDVFFLGAVSIHKKEKGWSSLQTP